MPANREAITINNRVRRELIATLSALNLFAPDRETRLRAAMTIFVIDVAAGDKIPRKGGPGITRSDLLVINKIDLAPMVGASLAVMERNAGSMRGDRPFFFTNLKTGQGLEKVIGFLEARGVAAPTGIVTNQDWRIMLSAGLICAFLLLPHPLGEGWGEGSKSAICGRAIEAAFHMACNLAETMSQALNAQSP